MKFSIVTLYVKNIDKSLKFYNEILQMPILKRQAVDENKELIFLGDKNGVQLELIKTDEEVVYSGFSIGYELENLNETKKTLLNEGYEVINEFSPSESVKLCFIKGPSGETVELIEYS